MYQRYFCMQQDQPHQVNKLTEKNNSNKSAELIAKVWSWSDQGHNERV